MRCNRTEQLDLAAFAVDRASEEWAEFRLHYPACGDCSQAVAEWAGLTTLLGETPRAGSAHPAPATLLAFSQEPERLDATERRSVERHLESCPSCALEHKVGRDFDLAALPSPDTATPASNAPVSAPSPSLGERLQDWIESLGALIPQPALAAAALVVVVGLATWMAGPREQGVDTPSGGPLVAAREELPSGSAHDVREETLAEAAPAELLIAQNPLPADTELPAATQPQSDPEPYPAPPPTQVALANPTGEPDLTRESTRAEAAPPPRPEKAVVEPVVTEVFLLAANIPFPDPVYQPDAMLAGGSLARFPRSTLIRATPAAARPELRVLAPPHVGATSNSAPTLYWYLAEESPYPIDVTLADDVAIDPLLEVRLEPPVAAGLHVLALEERGVRLEPDVTYEWWVRLVRDPNRPKLNSDSGAAIRFSVPEGARADALLKSEPAALAHTLAAQGYWYDAFATLTRWIELGSEAQRIRGLRAALLEQAGLPALPESR